MPKTSIRRKRKNRFQVKLKPSTIYSLAATVLFAISILVWLSFSRQGILLVSLNSILIANFGYISTWLIPLVLISGALLLIKTKNPLSHPNVVVGLLIIVISLSGLFPGVGLSGNIGDGLSLLISRFGANLFFLFTFAIGSMVALNIPLEEVINSLSDLLSKIKKPSLHIPNVKTNPITLPKFQLTPKKDNTSTSNIPSLLPKQLKIIGASQKSDYNAKPDTTGKTNTNSSLVSSMPQGASNIPWVYPSTSLLTKGSNTKADRGDVNANAGVIEKTLEAFGITAKVVEVNLGPAVTQYALEVAIGTKLSKISALGSDLALALAAPTGQIRIEAPIPGRSLVGIELPNKSPEFVSLKDILDSQSAQKSRSKLAVAMGLDVSGTPVIADIAKMPHVLIAGSTGSGKSVCINAFIASLLFRASPQELNFIMVDPKRVELSGYNGIPHLLSPVIVEPEKVLSALKWACNEMDRRYKLFSEVGVRNLEGYNELSGFQALPYIVILIDELADIMLFAPAEVEENITRIAQMARATGIHLVIATQRPSVDVITGLIKANIPARIAFAVSSMIDSRVIIDQPGAEKLLGKGDMLYVPPDQAKPSRIQGAFISDKDIRQLIDHIKKQGVQPHYTEEVVNTPVNVGRKGQRVSSSGLTSSDSQDPMYEQALRTIVQFQTASATFLQRKLNVGYSRAARILDELESAGAIGPGIGAKPRDILVKDVEAFLNPPKEA